MAKGIIVLDIPETCWDCICCETNPFEEYCLVVQRATQSIDSTPDWCPIKPMPERIEHKSRQGLLQEHMAVGWNACIDELMGGSDG